MTEDEMVGGHHQLDGHEFEQTLGVALSFPVMGVGRFFSFLQIKTAPRAIHPLQMKRSTPLSLFCNKICLRINIVL